MNLPDDTDFLNFKIADIVRKLAKNDTDGEGSLYAAQHGADFEKGTPPEVFVLIARGASAQIVYEVFHEIAKRHGLEFREDF